MLLPVATAVVYGETEGFSFAFVIVLCLAIGFLLTHKRPHNPSFYAREGFITTSLGWILMSVFGSLPFVLTGEIPRFVDALFETVSGFTTTGASILVNIEALSRCSLMWRSFTHWIGGMGVLVFLLAVLPMVGGSNMQLMRAESPGPSVGKLVPKVRLTARILYVVYLALTLIEFILLLLGGMSVFEAMCTAFGTAGTGGFGVKADSIASYSPYLQWVVGVFMVIFGVNFNVYFLLLMRRPREAVHCEEMRWYLLIIAVSTLLIFLNTYDGAQSAEVNLRGSFFQVASIITTTGFATVDFDLWPQFSKVILVMLMFVGACAGSTGGGLKVSRFVIAGKSVGRTLSSFLHPRSVRRIRFEGKEVEEQTISAVTIYFVTVILVFAFSVLILSLEENDLVTTFTAIAATFNNIGPGLAKVGPTGNFASFSVLSKCMMIIDMLAGRLELFPLLMLLYPPLWRSAADDTIWRMRRIRSLNG